MELISGHTQIRTISFSKPTEARQQIDNSCILNQAICRQLKIICVPSVFANLINKILYHIQPQDRFTASQHYVATILYIYKNSINDFRRNIHILRFTARAMSALQITSSCKFYPNTCIFVLLLHHTYHHIFRTSLVTSGVGRCSLRKLHFTQTFNFFLHTLNALASILCIRLPLGESAIRRQKRLIPLYPFMQ